MHPVQKQVILAKDHDADTRATIFHNDIRSYGKDFERFYQRAGKLPGVRFVRSYVSIGREIPETQNVTLRYATTDDGVQEEEFDLVVLGRIEETANLRPAPHRTTEHLRHHEQHSVSVRHLVAR